MRSTRVAAEDNNPLNYAGKGTMKGGTEVFGMVKYSWIVSIIMVAGCSSNGESGLNESCVKTADCAGALKCIDLTCVQIDGGVGGDALTPDTFTMSVDLSQQRKRIFITKEHYTGDLKGEGSGNSGIDGADKLCGLASQAANLGGHWKAWISDCSTDAIERIDDVGPWYLVGLGEIVFNNRANMATAPLIPIDRTEDGDSVERPYGEVWTGTQKGGKHNCSVVIPGEQCDSWTSTDGAGPYTGGTLGDGKSTAGWTNTGDYGNCDRRYRLYCVEQ